MLEKMLGKVEKAYVQRLFNGILASSLALFIGNGVNAESAYFQYDKANLEGKIESYATFPSNFINRGVDKLPMRDFSHFYTYYEDIVRGTKLEGSSGVIWELGIKNMIDPYFIASVILLETGNGRSKLLKAFNNVAGLKRRNRYMRFDDISDSIRFLFTTIRTHYVDKGLATPKMINRKYSADRKWAYKVARVMKQLYSY